MSQACNYCNGESSPGKECPVCDGTGVQPNMEDDSMNTRDKAWATMAKDALQAQDACNLSGLVFAFYDVMEKLCRYAAEHGKGTQWKNQHPITQLWVDKLASLAGTQGFDWHTTRTYQWAEAQVAAGDNATLEYEWDKVPA